MPLQDEIDRWRKEIKTDGYSMSLGELINLYQDGDLSIRPEFQRLFRWSLEQQSRFIESILLGIPIPSIFVATDPKGVWELVDGLQRVSTVLKLVGILKKDGQPVEPTVLAGTKYLPALNGKRWENPDDDADPNAFSATQRRDVKRAKVRVEILHKESDAFGKFELFKRLNTGGAETSPQEVRNCVLVAIDPTFFRWIDALRQDEDFKLCTDLSDRLINEQYDLELVCRFLAFRSLPDGHLRNIGDIGLFLDARMESFATDPAYPRVEEERAFRDTFRLLREELGENVFRKYEPSGDRFRGGFLISVFEALGIGLGSTIEIARNQRPNLRIGLAELAEDHEFQNWTGSGRRASERIPHSIPIGRRIFAP